MGQRITQKIYRCNRCLETPEDGEYLWEMGFAGTLCNKCTEDYED